MSVAQVLEEVDSWDPKDREALARRLKVLAILDDPAFIADITRGLDEIESGDVMTREELHRLVKEKRGITV